MLRRVRTTKNLAKRIDMEYFARPFPMRRWRFWLSVAIPALGLIWLVAHWVVSPEPFASGPVSPSHAAFGQKCNTCHTGVGGIYFRPVTEKADTYKYELLWSPDSKKVMWSDKKLRLQFVDVESKKVTLVDQAKAFEVRDFTWSPDSKWIAYTRPEVESLNKVYLYSLDGGKSHAVTDGWYAAGNPAFSADGTRRTIDPAGSVAMSPPSPRLPSWYSAGLLTNLSTWRISST